jgi:diguanylate cyclase
MTDTTTSFLPSYNFSPELNAKYLRKILQLMVQHQIPATPINYAIWYEVVAENNAKLNAVVNALIDEKKPFDSETSFEIYKKYICNATLESFEKINDQIQKIIGQTSTTIKVTHAKADAAQVSFQRNTTLLENITDAHELNAMLQNIIQETRSLAEVTTTMQTKLDKANQELEQMRQELTQVRQVASTDALTGLLNRRAFDQTLTMLLEQSQQKPACLSLLDIDHFKRVNDTYGHIVGDNVIKFIAAVMKKYTQSHHYVARYGGEEMAIIMPDTSKEEARVIAESIRDSMEKSLLKRKDNSEAIGKITVSIGFTVLQADDNAETLIMRADQALYKAKETGRNKVVSAEDYAF